MSVDAWVRIWRVVVLTVGAVDIFYTLFILLGVIIGRVKTSSYRRKVHIISIAASYLIFTTMAWLIIAERAVHGDPITYYLPFATIGFPLGIYALLALTAMKGEGH